ncbi:hypothetical protein LMG28688_06916 [Paraburkholderia caffeinitolerans]|uniref:DUF2875 domain-containing protein n=1 Tax=Paraburkholderia caffeinitolerans TaxID=1723730 RepID=A0A6J5GZL8_9BURK|nr:DUF2875 family protein [Paraburkholderia caffeinitolerans]CAB3809078.1 hypothetical protein LMG28688_06916 [Paraburkholderia caffeinitolerans]
MVKTLVWGILAGATCVALLFFGTFKVRSANAATVGAAGQPESSSIPLTATGTALAGGPIAAPELLELRAVGIRVDKWAQTQVWDMLKKQTDAYRSVLPTDAGSYAASRDLVQDQAGRALGSSFKYSAGEGVERWPVPVIIFGPPKASDVDNKIANFITTNRQAASLAQHMFLTAQAVNVTNPQAQIDYLFDFFAKNPQVPQVLIYGFDGAAVRTWFEHVSLPEGQYVPSQFDAMVGLLVSRTDRVDAYMRPFVSDDPEGAGPDDRQYDTIKLANFFWNVNSEPKPGLDVSPPSVEHWQSKLPLLWQSLDNKGPGTFKPDSWFPARWARWQLDEFDREPMLGYLHKPVAVRLTDANGQPLKAAAKDAAMREGWEKVQAQLPNNGKVARVFFDSVATPTVFPLLHSLTTEDGLDPTSITEGFDVGRRIGNVGIMGSMVGIAMSTLASYDLGQGSVTVNMTPDGQLHFILVTPPDEAEKAANTERRQLPADPFRHLMPRV